MPDEPTCRFVIPRPPSTNNLHGSHIDPKTGKQRRHNTRAYGAWIKEAATEIMLQVRNREAIKPPLRMLIEGVGQIDVDNIKAIPDICKRMGLIADDKLIDDLQILRRGEAVTVSIWPLANGTEADAELASSRAAIWRAMIAAVLASGTKTDVA